MKDGSDKKKVDIDQSNLYLYIQSSWEKGHAYHQLSISLLFKQCFEEVYGKSHNIAVDESDPVLQNRVLLATEKEYKVPRRFHVNDKTNYKDVVLMFLAL